MDLLYDFDVRYLGNKFVGGYICKLIYIFKSISIQSFSNVLIASKNGSPHITINLLLFDILEPISMP